MLSSFDWLRRSRTGAELLATLVFLRTRPDLFPPQEEWEEIGPPISALDEPCERCWLYAHPPEMRYCPTCAAITTQARYVDRRSRQAVLVWGYVNRLPRHLWAHEGFYAEHVWGDFVLDERHFLLMMHRRQLKPWLQELVLYHGSDLRGMVQIFPPSGNRPGTSMGEILCRVNHHERRYAMDSLRVRFFSSPHQLLKPSVLEKQGILTFEVADFLSLLEMAAVFRTVLRPEEQEILYQLVNLDNPGEERFYWGRLMGMLTQEAKDMLNSWRVRHWPPQRIRLLYDLIEYVEFYQAD